jgi:hypothetical protein
MNTTPVAVDLAKTVFQLAVADAAWKVIQTHRLTRSQFERWFANREVHLVIMEACGSAHHFRHPDLQPFTVLAAAAKSTAGPGRPSGF